ncbi:hypothetical protein ACFW6L_29640, partial [Pseudomonas otitidis]
PDTQRYRISALYQAAGNSTLVANGNQRRMLPASNGQWRFSPAFTNLSLPVRLGVADSQGVILGGWYIQGQKNAGVTYSSLGINGARLEVVN